MPSLLDGRSLLVLDCDVHLTRFEGVIPEGLLSGVEKKAPAAETATLRTNAPSDKVVPEEDEDVVTVRKLRRGYPVEETHKLREYPVEETRKLREYPVEETVPEMRDGIPGISTDDAFDGYQPDVGVPMNVGFGAICDD